MAKRVQVALTESIASLGKEGDLVEVAPGYARNFLLPYGKAMNVTPAVLKQIERKKEKEKIAADKLKQEALDFQTALTTMLDSKGVIHSERDDLNEWKKKFAIKTKNRTLNDAINGADVFLGLSQAGVLKKEMVKKMSKNPIVFACANPDPEIIPEDVEDVRDDAIIATGRSDYPNQVNNLIGFPYIFRGALDVRAKTINEEM